MAKSTLTGRYRTTLPRAVREELGIEPGDVLLWRVVGGQARMVPAKLSLLARRGTIEASRGSAVEDVRRVRRERGKESQSQLLERPVASEEIELTEESCSVARLVPVESRGVPRRPGAWKGQVWVADDFDAPLPLEAEVGFSVDQESGDER